MTKVLSIIGSIISIGNLPTTNIIELLKSTLHLRLFCVFTFDERSL